MGIVAAQPGWRTPLWIADATELDYDLSAVLPGAGRSRCPPRHRSDRAPKLSRLWSMDSTGCSRPYRGARYENGSCSRSDERTDVTPIIEARSETEPTESHPETVQAAVNIALVMAAIETGDGPLIGGPRSLHLVGESVARLGSIRRAAGVGGGRIPSGCLRLQSRRGSGRLVAAGAVRRVIAGRRGGVRG